MASTNEEICDPDSSDALSDALGTKALDVRSMVPNYYREALMPDLTNNGCVKR
jgi:hypothetical protein